MASTRAAPRIATRHLDGHLLPHELLAIHLKRHLRPRLHVLACAALPLAFWAPGAAAPSACGPHGGDGPHAAWFRCTVARIERQNMSDFPTLHYLATMSERYQQAIERTDPRAIRETEDELLRSSGEPAAQIRPSAHDTACPSSVVAFCD